MVCKYKCVAVFVVGLPGDKMASELYTMYSRVVSGGVFECQITRGPPNPRTFDTLCLRGAPAVNCDSLVIHLTINQLVLSAKPVNLLCPASQLSLTKHR